MTLRIPPRVPYLWLVVPIVLALVADCGGARRPAATPSSVPAAAASGPASSAQGLYESARYREVLSRLSSDVSPETLWFAVQSYLRLGQREDAARELARLPALSANPSWQTVSALGLALLAGDIDAIDRARATADAFPADPFVQFELGRAHVVRGDHAAAAQAFDRCAEADPRFAYAYYNAGLAYDRLKRADLMTARLETFQRLAREAPERPEVEAILLTIRGR